MTGSVLNGKQKMRTIHSNWRETGWY